MNEIPILNTQDRSFKRDLIDAFTTIGFAAIENGTIAENHIDPLSLRQAYKAAEIFFNLPQDDKNQNIVEGSHGQAGYTRFMTEKAKNQTVPDLKEFLQVSFKYNGQNAPDVFGLYYTILRDLFYQMNELAMTILEELSSDLAGIDDMSRNIGYVNERQTILRAIHYPPTGPNPSGVRSAEHEDINLITLLPASSAKGLQVLNKLNHWIDAPTDPSLIIVNVGDMFQEFTSGNFKSTTHRVVNTEEGVHNSRYSMPFFFHPKGDMVLSERYTAQSYLDQRLQEIGLKK